MKNQKLIAGSAMMGFCLSCLAGFIGGAGLLVIFLRALIFGLIFGVLGWGVGFVAEKFLDISVSDSSSLSSSSEKSINSPLEKTANTVDITIADENLPGGEQEPDFSVTNAVRTYHGILDNSKVAKEQTPSYNRERIQVPEVKKDEAALQNPAVNEKVPEVLSKPEEQPVSSDSASKEKKEGGFEGFVPDLSSVAEAEKTALEKEESAKPKSSSFNSSEDGELDELPDLSEIVEDDVKESGAMVSDSDFATAAPVKTETKSKGSVSDIKDTELLAQAIRTAIANDN